MKEGGSGSKVPTYRPWLFSILFFFILLEIGLRITGELRVYSETTGMGFVTYYGKTLPSWYHTWNPNLDINYDQPEFKFTFKANSLGVREKQIPMQKPDSVFRLICIGDSFTEGDGADYANSYPRFLEKKLNARAGDSPHFQVYNAGSAVAISFS